MPGHSDSLNDGKVESGANQGLFSKNRQLGVCLTYQQTALSKQC